MKRNFVGTEVLRHDKMKADMQDVTQQKLPIAWKTELLQVRESMVLILGQYMLRARDTLSWRVYHTAGKLGGASDKQALPDSLKQFQNTQGGLVADVL